jgi:hypothetical protein
MKPNNEWDYLAEGNLHVVLKSNNDQHLGFVIRLTKFAP